MGITADLWGRKPVMALGKKDCQCYNTARDKTLPHSLYNKLRTVMGLVSAGSLDPGFFRNGTVRAAMRWCRIPVFSMAWKACMRA